MSERKRFVTISPWDGTVTTLKDVDDGSAFLSVRGSFQVKQGARKQALAQQTRRYGGALVTGESHENDSVTWKALVKGATTDEVIQNAEAMLLVSERARWDTFFEWRPENATASTYYRIQGPAAFDLTYEWAQLAGAQSMVVDVTVPVHPLACGDLTTQTLSGFGILPQHLSALSTIGGNAPALVDVAWRFNGGSSPSSLAPVWCLFGWTPRATSPMASSFAPFGIIASGGMTDLTTWATFSTGAANYLAVTGLRCTASGAGSASAALVVDPSTLQPDDFTRDTIDIEVWARIEIASGITAPRMTLSLEPFAGTNFGAAQYTPEHGSAGKLLVNKPSSGTKMRLVRLGTLTMPVDVAQPLKWKVKVAASWTGGSGIFGLDYLALVPARSRACTRSGVELNAAYPRFIASTSDTNKLIRSDLSGLVASGSGNFGPDSGMGGSPIELPAGDVDIVVLPSSQIPDDPVANSNDTSGSFSGVTGKLYITPRYFLARA